MKELHLICDFNDNDSITINENGDSDKVIIDVIENEEMSRAFLGKEKAAQLRDWLNEFLGE